METAATLLVDNLLAALLQDQVRSESDLMGAILTSEEPKDELEAAWMGVDRMSTLRSCSQDWDGDLDVVRISTSLLYVIPRDGTRIRDREMGYVGIQSTNRITNVLVCRSIVQHCLNLSHTKDEVFVRVLILKNIAKCLKELIRQTHRVLFNEILRKEERCQERKRAWLQTLEDKEGLKGMLLGISVDILLFDWERDALKILVEMDDDFLVQLDRVCYPMCDLGCSRKGGLKPMGVAMRNCALDVCIKAVARTVSNFETLKAMNFQLFCLFLYPVLYILDVASDVLVAKNHFDNSDIYYFSLTVLFIFGPLLAEITNKIWWKYVARGGKSTWTELLFPESITLLPRQNYNRDLEKFYAELLSLRFAKDYEGQTPKWINSPNLIQTLCYSRMIQNEMYVFDWKMMECLNESAPQLLLQLYIVYQDLFLRESIDIICWVGIITSLASLSWTLHLSHYNMHYEELKNNFGTTERLVDFFSHFLMICSRFLAVSLIASMAPYLFLAVAAVYLTLLSLYLVFVSKWRKVYRLLLKNRKMLFWPAYRLFITPYLLRLWRIDNEDDVLFHLETIAMAVCWSLISPPMTSLEGLRWILLSVIISIDLLCLPALVWVNNRFHMPARNCRGGKWNLKLIAEVAKLEYEDLS
ncbi:hypothetical protein J437_LFUL007037 [Ladona fulva]|uniref:XK-related protein n=1 Tax=Ladona fulva TaxID=123851 RepID=A0A8K0P252_LADFU|nr:hypothetical protein J437_LFUL007037 [Ladona fulva]